MLNNPLKYTDPDGLEALRIGRAAYDSVSAGVSDWYETNFTPVDHYGSSGQPFLPRMNYLDSDQPLISQSIQNNLVSPAYNLAADIWNTPWKVQTGHATDMEMVETAAMAMPFSKTVTTGLKHVGSKITTWMGNKLNAVTKTGQNLSDDLSSTFMGNKYETRVLDEDLITYRAGTKDQPLGQFFSHDAPISEIQVRIDKAVRPTWPGGGTSPIDTGFKVKFPKGTMVYEGSVGPQGQFYLGGTEQIVVPKPWLIKGVEVIESFPLIK